MRKINVYVIDRNRCTVWRDISGSIDIARKADDSLKYFSSMGTLKPYRIFRSEKEYQLYAEIPKADE